MSERRGVGYLGDYTFERNFRAQFCYLWENVSAGTQILKEPGASPIRPSGSPLPYCFMKEGARNLCSRTNGGMNIGSEKSGVKVLSSLCKKRAKRETQGISKEKRPDAAIIIGPF